MRSNKELYECLNKVDVVQREMGILCRNLRQLTKSASLVIDWCEHVAKMRQKQRHLERDIEASQNPIVWLSMLSGPPGVLIYSKVSVLKDSSLHPR